RGAAVLEYFTVQIDLRDRLGVIAAGQPAQHWRRRVGFAPSPQPALGIEMERIREDEPAVGLVRFDAGLQVPVTRAIALLGLFLRETECSHLRARQRIKTQRQAWCVLNFPVPDDKAVA